MKKTLLSLLCLICSFNAHGLEVCGTLEQGGIVVVNGNQLVAFDRDALINQKIDGHDIKIKEGKWDIQNLSGIQQNKVTPSKQDEAAINYEAAKVKEAFGIKEPQQYWKSGFVEPLKGRISGTYGGQRIMNGEKKNPHMGLDIASPQGTEIKAASDGVVVLAEPDLFYSGNMVIVNHGDELRTVYAHLSRIDVKLGQVVKQGQIIGLVGKTGRVTGPHLHFGTNYKGIKFNPQNLYNLMKNKESCVRF